MSTRITRELYNAPDGAYPFDTDALNAPKNDVFFRRGTIEFSH
jgi:hypothetical protein